MTTDTTGSTPAPAPGRRTLLTVLAWAWVILPFLYGVWQLTTRIPALF